MLISLLLSLSLFSVAQTEAADCSRLWRRGFPDPGHETEELPCTPVVNSNLSSKLELYVDDFFASYPTQPTFSETVSKALAASRGSYLFGGKMPNVKAVIYSRPHFNDGPDRVTYAAALIMRADPRLSEACPVIIYPAARQFDAEKLKQIIAHEMFHCFQWKNAANQAMLADLYGFGLWYIEGTAQMMSDVVFPRADIEWGDMFPRYNPNLSLIDQDGYANVIFFMSWYRSSLFSSNGITAFLTAMPTDRHSSLQAAFALVPHAAEYFHQFAQGFNAGTLVDSAGRPTPYRPREPETTQVIQARPEQVIDVSVVPLKTQYHRLVLPKKGRYRISVSAGDSPYIRLSTKPASAQDWVPLTDEIRSPCEADLNQDLLITSINPDQQEAAVTLRINYEEEYECGCESSTPPEDECLAGTWLLDHESTRQYFEKSFQGTNNELLSIRGAYQLRFDRAGEMEFLLDNWVIDTATAVESTGNKVKMRTTANGKATARYADQQKKRVCARRTSGNLTFQHIVYIGNPPLTTPANPILLPADGRIEFTYQCSGNELIYQQGLGVGANGTNVEYNFKFVRQ